MIKVAVVGATGYTGAELLRLLAVHPEVDLVEVTSRAEQGRPVWQIFPNLRGFLDLEYTVPDLKRLSDVDLVYFATPNGVAMTMVPELMAAGIKVIDLAADFRIKDIPVWEQWYGMSHACPDWVEKAVYGLPEIHREQIKNAQLVANPGCYPTSVQLGFMPLIKEGLVDTSRLISDSKSGVSGAGRKADMAYLQAESSENFKAYAVNGHRHLPEIKQGLVQAGGKEVGLTFVPHLLPMIRGIESTLYATLLKTDVDLQALYEQAYQDEIFVDVLPAGTVPETRSVKGANHCRISVFRPQQSDTVVVSSVIDNLVKGAGGQAVQNMNIMFGFKEDCGLNAPALLP